MDVISGFGALVVFDRMVDVFCLQQFFYLKKKSGMLGREGTEKL